MMRMQERKALIRAFMQQHYTDERLAQLLCHARDGKLSYWSCCCFIGIPTADHQLQSYPEAAWAKVGHYNRAKGLIGAEEAEAAYAGFGIDGNDSYERETIRRRILIPMIRAEMKRRERLRPSEPPLPPKETPQVEELSHTPSFRR